jgi:predicted 3-demethylubiquinone-9 3-methyltransferase (glyoxalase superfamily)
MMGDPAKAGCVMAAMMKMTKIEIQALKDAAAG